MLTQNGATVHALQDASGGLLIVDRVVIPEGIPPGEYVLGWRAFHCCLLYVGRAFTMMLARSLLVFLLCCCCFCRALLEIANLNHPHALLRTERLGL